MRILVVSAHFPPNFVSGGTLAAQRQAHGLRAMGHDVSVYAGWLGNRPALDSWTDRDTAGMDVRWVVTTPWIEYGDRNNYDNPAVTADFALHLAEVHPDVVHFHSIQTLGAGLLQAAAEAGCRILVTMHDFWWWCARQFLVTRDFKPCCLVVSCGVCPCEVDADWLAARHEDLARYLAHADLVLTVSHSAAEVLAANGLDPARLRVDENGVPPTFANRARRQQHAGDVGSDLRLTYTGGPLRLKGVHVVLDAARQMGPIPGWRLTAYGAQPFVEQEHVDLAGLPVELRPPFDPAEAEPVFADTDVLVVPSVMRETYSLVTREALTRGVPVVCTDSLGPEEVVVHEHNGLVVPAGDSAALAAALRRLLSESNLLERLRAGCQEVRVRSLDDQVAGLDGLYRELLSSPRPATAGVPAVEAPRSISTVLFIVGIEGAPLRYRVRLPAEALELVGVQSEVRHYRDAEVPQLATEADALVVYRVPATAQVLEVIADVRKRGVAVFFDVDDLIFDPDVAEEIPALSILPPAEAQLWMEGVRRYRTTMEACDVYIGSTAALCRHAQAVVGLPAERFANGVGRTLARLSDAASSSPRSPGPVRVGYLSGTKTHDHDWLHIEPAVARLLDDHPDVELCLVGLVRPSAELGRFGARVRHLPLLPWTELPLLVRNLDVNLAPLQPRSRFNDAKSAIKWLEAALTATPTVASPSEPFREAIRHGENGMLAGTEDEWTSALELLVADEDMRRRLGRRAQRDALLRWSPHLQANRYIEILEHGPRRERRHSTGWEPVVRDEPSIPIFLEPYKDACLETPVTPTRRPRWRQRLVQVCSLAGRALRSLLEDGPVVTAERAMSSCKREWRTLADRRRWRAAAGKARRLGSR